MTSRFTAPDLVRVPWKDLPDPFNDPLPEVPGSKALRAVQVVARLGMLHIVRDEDKGTEMRAWTAEAYLAIMHLRSSGCRALATTEYREGDTPESIGDEFARDLMTAVASTLLELGGLDDEE